MWTLNRNLGWDDPFSEGFRCEWLQFFQEFQRLQDISFDRSIKPDKAVGNPILVVFSDGSGEAYGTASYPRWRIPDQPYESRLIAARNRIAPIKTVDIVRLELSGAVLGKRLRSFMQEELRYSFEKVYHIVDSEIVKAMIGKESYGFNTFAANRIGEIQQKTNPSELFWVQGILNIADWITRGKSPVDLGSQSIWQKGPEFLCHPEEEWPVVSKTSVTDLLERVKTVFVAMADNIVEETLASRIDIE